jgi:hypothetical protein
LITSLESLYVAKAQDIPDGFSNLKNLATKCEVDLSLFPNLITVHDYTQRTSVKIDDDIRETHLYKDGKLVNSSEEEKLKNDEIEETHDLSVIKTEVTIAGATFNIETTQAEAIASIVNEITFIKLDTDGNITQLISNAPEIPKTLTHLTWLLAAARNIPKELVNLTYLEADNATNIPEELVNLTCLKAENATEIPEALNNLEFLATKCEVDLTKFPNLKEVFNYRYDNWISWTGDRTDKLQYKDGKLGNKSEETKNEAEAEQENLDATSELKMHPSYTAEDKQKVEEIITYYNKRITEIPAEITNSEEELQTLQTNRLKLDGEEKTELDNLKKQYETDLANATSYNKTMIEYTYDSEKRKIEWDYDSKATGADFNIRSKEGEILELESDLENYKKNLVDIQIKANQPYNKEKNEGLYRIGDFKFSTYEKESKAFNETQFSSQEINHFSKTMSSLPFDSNVSINEYIKLDESLYKDLAKLDNTELRQNSDFIQNVATNIIYKELNFDFFTDRSDDILDIKYGIDRNNYSQEELKDVFLMTVKQLTNNGFQLDGMETANDIFNNEEFKQAFISNLVTLNKIQNDIKVKLSNFPEEAINSETFQLLSDRNSLLSELINNIEKVNKDILEGIDGINYKSNKAVENFVENNNSFDQATFDLMSRVSNLSTLDSSTQEKIINNITFEITPKIIELFRGDEQAQELAFDKLIKDSGDISPELLEAFSPINTENISLYKKYIENVSAENINAKTVLKFNEPDIHHSYDDEINEQNILAAWALRKDLVNKIAELGEAHFTRIYNETTEKNEHQKFMIEDLNIENIQLLKELDTEDLFKNDIEAREIILDKIESLKIFQALSKIEGYEEDGNIKRAENKEISIGDKTIQCKEIYINENAKMSVISYEQDGKTMYKAVMMGMGKSLNTDDPAVYQNWISSMKTFGTK